MRINTATRWRSMGLGSDRRLNFMKFELDASHGSDKDCGEEDPAR
jgi:hypothetical protein